MDWKPSERKRSASDVRGVRLNVEQLEDRTVPSIFTPAQIEQAYGFNEISFPSSHGSATGLGAGQTIAIVDAYDDPNIVSDLATFDKAFNLPAPPSFTVVKQAGTVANAQWASEIALDVEWAHAIAPAARIVLGEAKSDSLSDLVGEVVAVADMPGVSVVSMSWSAPEWGSETNFDTSLKTPAGHTGVTFVASSGDEGAVTGWPASSPNVLSVGGTALYVTSSGAYSSETAWSYGGGGVSPYETKPAFQTYVSTGATMRSTPDVSFDASPATGIYTYNSYEASGWTEEGGTSAGTPQWAALIAIADQGRALQGKSPLDGATQTLYAIYRMAQTAPNTYFHDVQSGSNGIAAKTGYDDATGIGSPIAYAVVAGLIAWNGTGTSGYVGAVSLPTTITASAKADDATMTLFMPAVSSGAVGTDSGGTTTSHDEAALAADACTITIGDIGPTRLGVHRLS